MHSLVQKYTDVENENRKLLEDINTLSSSGSETVSKLFSQFIKKKGYL